MKPINKLRLHLIDIISGLKIFDVLEQYKKDQYLSRNELDVIRQKKLEQLFSVAKQSTQYYAQFSNYAEIPVLNKKMISENPSAFVSGLYNDKKIKKSTSGSTGTPFTYHISQQGQSHLWAGLLLSWESTGYQFGENVAFVAGNALIKKSLKHKIFYRLMNIDLYPVAVMTDNIVKDYLEIISKRNTALIYGYVTAINTMADYILKNNIAPPAGLKAIVCTSEMLTDNARANIEKAFAVKVYNQYGCNEAGVSAFECGHHKLHIISSRSVFEINEDGNFISTDLANESDIFMKYDTGDLVEFSKDSCACGRNYPVIENIIGRSADVIVDRSDKKIHTTFFTHLFQRNPSIKKFQVVYDEVSIKLNLGVDQDFSQHDFTAYKDAMKNNLDFETYEITTNKEFYSKSNMKHTFIVDQRNALK